MGMVLIWVSFGSIGFDDVLYDHQKLASMDPGRITLICLLLFLGAMGKSAQFPLHVWLPDAMEGPTPVSALIHAATMVTAGVYLTARCLPLFSLSENAQLVVTGVGAITALIAAITALTQFDLKRVLAYSTVSQLGFLFMALGAGVGAGDEGETHAATAAMFHLFTHAYFKALLFLAAGSVMHAMGDVIDMRRFGGLRKSLPITHWTFLIGAATLAGVPLLSGFWSKDEIFVTLSHASHHESYGTFYAIVFWAAVGTATLTAFYTFRAYFMTFWGEERFPEEAGHHPHEATPVMAWPLRVLAICAAAVGIVLGPTHLFGHYLQHSRGFEEVAAPSLNWGMMALSTLITGAGIGLSWLFYVKSPAIPGKLSTALRPLHALSSNKFYFDEIYGALVVLPLWGLAKLSAAIDFSVIDKIVDRVGDIPHVINGITRRTQHGLIPGYALMMFGGAVFGLLIAMGLFD
jgi:NADH-quinone oxidoreductase subunit L